MEINRLLSRFTIYHYMIFFLSILILLSALFYGFGANALVPVLIAIATATLLDFAINYFKFRELEFPQSALISGLFIGGILAQGLQWHIYAVAAAIAVLSKHIIKFRQKHVFNPASIGILLVSLIFGVAHTWWISSPILLVMLFGIFIIWRMKRVDLAMSFVAAYFGMILIINVLNPVTCPMMGMRCPMQPSPLPDLYYSVINGGVIYFFAMYMLIEPKTHPRSNRIVYGVFVAILLVAAEKTIPQHSIPLALAAGNMLVPLVDRLSLRFKKS